MTMSTLTALILGRKITLRERLVIQEALGQPRPAGVVRLTRAVLLATLAIEGAGALLLALRWGPELGWSKGIYYGVFHAVSAFCNAGFDLFGASLTGYRGDWLVNLVIAGLIILGGLGFGTLVEIRNRSRRHKFSLQTKLVLTTTGLLLAGGFIGIMALEYSNPATLAGLPGEEKALATFFHAVVPRTAGFATLNIGAMRPATLFMIIIQSYSGKEKRPVPCIIGL